MRLMNLSILAAGLISGAALLSGTNSAAATTLAPALAQTGDEAAVHAVRHDLRNRPNRLHGPRYRGPKNDPYHRSVRRGFRGPDVGFGLSMPGFSFGLGVPTGRYNYGYSRPYGYGPYGYGYRGYGY